jgi:hypothetical protein
VAKRLQPWDQYVADAAREPVELPITADEVLTIQMPSGGALRRMSRALGDNDLDTVMRELLGEQAGNRVLELFDSAPAGTLNKLVEDVMGEFGLSVTQGNPPTSPN